MFLELRKVKFFNVWPHLLYILMKTVLHLKQNQIFDCKCCRGDVNSQSVEGIEGVLPVCVVDVVERRRLSEANAGLPDVLTAVDGVNILGRRLQTPTPGVVRRGHGTRRVV